MGCWVQQLEIPETREESAVRGLPGWEQQWVKRKAKEKSTSDGLRYVK
jgi:hypothetical protein